MLKAKEVKMESMIRMFYLSITVFITFVYVLVASQNKIDNLMLKVAQEDVNYESSIEVKKSLDCMAINIYREAGYEPFEGKVAVAQVVMNRVKNERFPDTVCEVVYQKGPIRDKIICQFSWYCDSVHRNRKINEEAYEEAYKVAKMVYLENFRLESMQDALFYHADYVNPNWRLPKISQIGAHIFYKGKYSNDSQNNK